MKLVIGPTWMSDTHTTILHELYRVRMPAMCATSVFCRWKEMERLVKHGPNTLTVQSNEEG